MQVDDCRFANNERYTGTVADGRVVDGNGTYEYIDDKATFAGRFEAGTKQGHGTLTWQTTNSRTKGTTQW